MPLRVKAWPPSAKPIPDWRRASGDSSNGAMIVSTYCELVERLMFESGPPDISSESPRRLAEGIALANRRTLCSTSGGSPLRSASATLCAPRRSCPSAPVSERAPAAPGWRPAARQAGREGPGPRPEDRPSSRAALQGETAPRPGARDGHPALAPGGLRRRPRHRPPHKACPRVRRVGPGPSARTLSRPRNRQR